MQVIETTVYSFDELSDQAKEKARDQYRANSDFLWSDEAENSIKEFCGHFGIKLIYWNVAPYSSPDYSAEYFNVFLHWWCCFLCICFIYNHN